MSNGSTANSVGNNIYKDLILTRYPEAFDERAGSKKNPNLTRWTNLKDYNMAEHVNSLQDALMSVQRVLGEMAQMPANPVDKDGKPITNASELLNIAQTHSVKERLDALETKDWFAIFDKRYGGPSWTFDEDRATNPTIQEHRHLGSASGIPGMPEKIVLTQEVQGKLPKANINLAKTATGLTGADIFVDRQSPSKISEALNDKISETTGGHIKQDAVLTNDGKTNTRWTREYDVLDAVKTGNSVVSDSKTLLGQCAQSGATAASNLLSKKLEGMYFGRYVLIVRLSCSSRLNSNVVQLSALDGAGKTINSMNLKGTDFDKANTYQNFYLIFDHDNVSQIRVRKLATSSNAQVKFDYAIVEPVHPAVFDR